ncbi:cupin domain-containing protein [Parasalinivibrio latis]|uniref:cupin domain-containing protein n=1 Tax=Parasalinivibrio latis TaxID=2952610 RepID=UPI0030DED85F
MPNLLSKIPQFIPDEIFEDIVSTQNIRIERIISHGQSTVEGEWYDQDDNEWVLVLSGYGIIEFDDGRKVRLNHGDYININAHERHRVIETAPDEITVWLVVFYR